MKNLSTFMTRTGFIAFLLIAASVFTASAALQQSDDPASRYREHVKKGDVYLSQKNYAAAMFEYEKASELLPDEDQAKLKMQSIEATLGINELAEVKKKVEQARQKERDELAGKKTTPSAVAAPPVQVATVQSVSRIDSLQRVIRTIEEKKLPDTEKASAYAEIGNAYYSSGNFQDALNAFETSLDLKEKTGDKAGVSTVMAEIANVYETTYEYKSAISYFQKSARLKDSLKDDKGLKDVMNNLGDVYYKQKVLTNSILSYEKTVTVSQKLLP
jgi:tetratricopeptide (TPR) repeat protein